MLTKGLFGEIYVFNQFISSVTSLVTNLIYLIFYKVKYLYNETSYLFQAMLKLATFKSEICSSRILIITAQFHC